MNDSPVVSILMATFNGGAYLREQLDSLIGQTYTSWRLVVHDDGSTDDTLLILGEYQRRDPRISIMDDGVTNLGPAANFLHLMRHVEAQFYMFCDQDDIWLPEKVNHMVAGIAKYEGPTVLYTNSYLYVGDTAIAQKSTVIHPSTLRDTLFFNSGIQGCAVIFNRQLMDILRPFPDTIAMHDHLITMGAVTFGQIVYLDEVLVWYRQHSKNATGNQPRGTFRKLISFLAVKKPVISRSHYYANEAFYAHYRELIDVAKKELFQAYFRYTSSRSVLERLFIVLKHKFALGNKRGLLLVKTMIRTPID
ncbi:glycosyltransferase family 2 protein [Parapedobacter sp. 10938]|uniref:glycosyltransferase family 2 protein n=1 Tax=Parapedobacter flavus TaxID=3110225 RepID=UPI002DB79B7A|nr:glycosyltransferase family 2 protein [Parapedobacter sp. 10938]MEC3879544.1 glycosyltransferase family 2 protein [Parapedobacter sp. 10938]